MANRDVLQELHEVINSKHQLAGGAREYIRRFNALHEIDMEKGDELVGTVPEGTAPNFNWDRDKFEVVTLTAFINAADPMGVMLTGVKAVDHITVTSASGLAAFTEAMDQSFQVL